MDKQDVVHPYHGILFSLKNEGDSSELENSRGTKKKVINLDWRLGSVIEYLSSKQEAQCQCCQKKKKKRVI
jgi:hypothetical protein